MAQPLMVWTILSLSLTNGDYTVAGQYTSQHACIKVLSDRQPPEFKAHIHQCVRVAMDDLNDYKKDLKDWRKINGKRT